MKLGWLAPTPDLRMSVDEVSYDEKYREDMKNIHELLSYKVDLDTENDPKSVETPVYGEK